MAAEKKVKEDKIGNALTHVQSENNPDELSNNVPVGQIEDDVEDIRHSLSHHSEDEEIGEPMAVEN